MNYVDLKEPSNRERGRHRHRSLVSKEVSARAHGPCPKSKRPAQTQR